ncbi:MAG: hypothetical protein ACR2NT_05090 [Acidimicrobiia bacterium]
MSKEFGWRLSTQLHPFWVLGSTPQVNHRGYLYPERFEATWIREDGLEVEIEIRVDAVEGPIPMAATIRRPDGIRRECRQPIPAMTKQAAAQIALASDPHADDGSHSVSLPNPGTSIPMGRVSRPTATEKADRLQRVTQVYREAIAARKPVTKAVAASEFVTDSTAQGLIWQARKAGLIPPTDPGRKKA